MVRSVGILLLVIGLGVLVASTEAPEPTHFNVSESTEETSDPTPDNSNSTAESPPLRPLDDDTFNLKTSDQRTIEHEQPTAAKLIRFPEPASQLGYSLPHVTLYRNDENQVSSSTVKPFQSSSVECYVCADCPEANNSTPRKRCPHTNKLDKSGQCVVYAQKYKNMDRLWYIRGCPQERGTCQEIEEAHLNNQEIVSLYSCNECKGDLCNGAFASVPHVLFTLLALVASPVIITSLLK